MVGPLHVGAREIAAKALKLYWELLIAMVPVMIAVRIAIEFGLIEHLATLLAPTMGVIGLPAEGGLVLAMGILVNNYGAAAALVGILPYTDFTIAQLTVLLSMVLLAHALPLEQAIARRAGLSFTFSTALRLITAFAYGWLLNALYTWGDWLQAPASLAWLPSDHGVPSNWGDWAIDSAVSLFWLFWIILGLVTLLKIFDILKITDWIARRLSPLLRIMGISKAATPITMVGVLLGLSFGGGLIIQESRAGHLSARDTVLALSFMSICHSLIEDPLFMIALGGDVTGVLIGRFIFAVIVMVALSRLILALPDPQFRRWLYRGVKTAAT